MARIIPPEATLERMQPVLAGLGITRVANQTGLDHLGIPVFSAIRPNSRSLATHQGKGLTAAAARASAVMEAAECFLAENAELPLRLGRAEDLPGALDPARLPRRAGAPTDDPRLLWTPGRDLASGGARLVPHELVHADYTLPQPPLSWRFRATTNGLASGNTEQEAQLHALYEVIERDALTLWRLAPAQRGRIDPASVDDPACRTLLDGLARADVVTAIWDLVSETGLAAYLCLLVPPDGGLAGIEPEVGSGCHLSPGVALSRAITEAAQARVTRIVGARDDYDPESYRLPARRCRLEEARAWLAVPSLMAFRPAPPPTGLAGQIEAVLAGLVRRGCDEAVWVDLSRPGLPFHGGRVVVPGLAAPA